MATKRPLELSNAQNECHMTVDQPKKPKISDSNCSPDGENVDFSAADFDDSFDDVLMTQTHSSESDASANHGERRLKITCVKAVNLGRSIRLSVQNGSRDFELELTGRWSCDDIYQMGSYVNIHPLPSVATGGKCTVDDSFLVILHPDFLISGTTIVSSLGCKRKTILGEIFKEANYAKPLLLGNILHQMFSDCFQASGFSKEFYLERYKSMCKSPAMLEAFYALGMTPQELRNDVESYFAPISQLLRQLENGVTTKNSGLQLPKISCHEVERSIWSPLFGIKGKIDVISRTHIAGKVRNIALELKTGKESFSLEHQDQVRLYNLLLDDVKSNIGILVYLKSAACLEVTENAMSIRELIIIRNKIVFWLAKADGSSLDCFPDLEEDEFGCKYCRNSFTCGLIARAIEGKEPKLQDIHSRSSSLKAKHMQFFQRWLKLTMLEYRLKPVPSYSDIWLSDYTKRVANGLCHGHLTVESQSPTSDGVIIRFVSEEMITNLTVDDRVLISLQDLSQINVGSGAVTSVEGNSVEVLSEQPLKADNISSVLYRVDKTEGSSSSLSLMSSNLSRLMEPDNNQSNKLRMLIIDAQDPRFEESDRALIPQHLREPAKEILRGLNGQQKLAVRKVLMAHDYTIIRGMPGTGKTTVIVAVIRLQLLVGNRVLLTSFTNAAVDNVILRLRRYPEIKMVRLGVKGRVHPDLTQFLPSHFGTSYDTLSRRFDEADVVAGTVFNVNHPLFAPKEGVRRRGFDICIVDEASQILLPLCVGPVLCAGRFVLVGDEMQLPPLVTSQEAKAAGLDESLFQHMAARSSKGVFSLVEQYRMNTEIMTLCNIIAYSHQMKCGSQHVAERTLQLTTSGGVSGWVAKCCDPARPVIFLDTNGVRGETSRNSSYCNPEEVSIISQILQYLDQCLVPMCEVGIICPYRAQLVEAQTALSGIYPAVEIHTVDKFQGRDKSVILLTCVKSSRRVTKNELLNDVHRVNVAVSRAKCKLLILGDLPTITMYDPMRKLVSHFESNSLIVQYVP